MTKKAKQSAACADKERGSEETQSVELIVTSKGVPGDDRFHSCLRLKSSSSGALKLDISKLKGVVGRAQQSTGSTPAKGMSSATSNSKHG